MFMGSPTLALANINATNNHENRENRENREAKDKSLNF